MKLKFKLLADGWKDYGYLAAVEPQYAVGMSCKVCKVKWIGCWDEFQCPECGEGELPSCGEYVGGRIEPA